VQSTPSYRGSSGAECASARVLPIHAHLACAFPKVETVELIPEESRADPLHRLLCNVPAAREEKMSPDSETEIGISIAWEAVEKLSQRHVVIARKLTQVWPPMLD
jgi:hypothetical protein